MQQIVSIWLNTGWQDWHF